MSSGDINFDAEFKGIAAGIAGKAAQEQLDRALKGGRQWRSERIAEGSGHSTYELIMDLKLRRWTQDRALMVILLGAAMSRLLEAEDG